MGNSKRKCRECKEFKPVSEGKKHPIGWFCSEACTSLFVVAAQKKATAKKQAAAKREHGEKERAFKRETRERKEALKSRGDHLKAAQMQFNRFIRMRDHGNSCISCGRNTGSKINAGHYKSVGSHPELRFNELNCNLQCEHCNTHLSGNQMNYRPALVDKIGLDKVEWLEGPHEPAKWSIEDIKAIQAKYRFEANILEKALDL
jgi:5-methylcytosine-specific restriction endonuclease McrA